MSDAPIFYVEWMDALNNGDKAVARALTARFDKIDARLSKLEAEAAKPVAVSETLGDLIAKHGPLLKMVFNKDGTFKEIAPIQEAEPPPTPETREPGWYWTRCPIRACLGLRHWKEGSWWLNEGYNYKIELYDPIWVGPRISEPGQ